MLQVKTSSFPRATDSEPCKNISRILSINCGSRVVWGLNCFECLQVKTSSFPRATDSEPNRNTSPMFEVWSNSWAAPHGCSIPAVLSPSKYLARHGCEPSHTKACLLGTEGCPEFADGAAFSNNWSLVSNLWKSCESHAKIIPLGHLLSPNFGIFKVEGGCPMEKYSATLGCNQRKVWSFSERSLLETCKGINRTLATGTLSRDVCPHGPKIDSGYFLCNMYAWGLCPFLGTEIYSEKSLAPRNLSGINLGTTLRRHHTRGSGFVLAGFFSWPCAQKIIPLGHLLSPNFGIFKVEGGCPMEKYSATLGLQPKKSVEFLGAEFVGDLQRDK